MVSLHTLLSAASYFFVRCFNHPTTFPLFFSSLFFFSEGHCFSFFFFFCFLMIRPPPNSTLFPYPTLFRSHRFFIRPAGKTPHPDGRHTFRAQDRPSWGVSRQSARGRPFYRVRVLERGFTSLGRARSAAEIGRAHV